jgi:hypothetical protein
VEAGELGMADHACNPSTQRLKQEDGKHSGPAWTTQQDHVSKTQAKSTKPNQNKTVEAGYSELLSN